MNKKILSIIVMLALAISVVIGTVVVANANEDVDGLSLTLEDSITAHIQVTNCTGASYANISLEDENGEIVKTYENVSLTSNNGSTVVVSFDIAVKDIDKWIYVDVVDENGETVGSYDCGVSSYLEEIYYDDTATNGEKATAVALIGYAQAAKDYFAGLTNDEVEAPVPVEFNAPAKIAVGSVPGLTHSGVTLVLESETTIRHYFQIVGDIADYTFYVDYDMDGDYDEACDYGYYETEKVEAYAYGSYYIVDITGIAPSDLDRSYTLGVKKADSTYTYKYSALNYAEDAWGSANNALQNLLVNLKGYLDGAAQMKGTINYMDGATLIGTADYQYGVDNYIDFLPAKDNSVFLGWYSDDELTEQANVIEAGTTGDVTVYAKWQTYAAHDIATQDNNGAGLQEALLGGGAFHKVTYVESTDQIYFLNKYTDAYMTLVDPNQLGHATDSYNNGYALIKVNNNSGYGATLQNQLDGTPSGTKIFKMSLELASVANMNVLPLSIHGGWSSTYGNVLIVTGKDKYVYCGQVDEAHKVAELKDGILSTIEVYLDFTNPSIILCTFENLAGDTMSFTADNVLGATHAQGAYLMLQAGKQTLGDKGNTSMFELKTNAGLSVGKFHVTAVPQGENKIVDAEGNKVMAYNAFEAVRLPEQYGDGKLEFAGWYADADLTKQINSIPAGLAGVVTVYPKFINSTNLVYMVDGKIVKQVACTPDAETPIDYIPTPAPGYLFEGWYTDDAFTTKAPASVPAGSEGNTIVYAKLGNYDFFTADGLDFQDAMDKTTYTNKKVNVDGTVTYTGVSGSYKVLGPSLKDMTNDTLPTINGTKITTYKISLEIAREANTPVAGFNINGVYAGTYITVDSAAADADAYVRFAGGVTIDDQEVYGGDVLLAKLPADGGVVTVEFYISFEGFDFDTNAAQRVHAYGYNTSGVLVECGTWGATLNDAEYYMFRLLPSTSNTTDSSITIGEFHATPVNADFTPITEVTSVG